VGRARPNIRIEAPDLPSSINEFVRTRKGDCGREAAGKRQVCVGLKPSAGRIELDRDAAADHKAWPRKAVARVIGELQWRVECSRNSTNEPAQCGVWAHLANAQRKRCR